MDSTNTRIAKGDAREVARHNHLAHTVEAVVGTLVSYLLEDRDDDLPSGFAKDGGVGIALGREEGLDSIDVYKRQGPPSQWGAYSSRCRGSRRGDDAGCAARG